MSTGTLLKPIDFHYGSDEHGLVWGYLFIPGEEARQINLDGAIEYLATPDPAQVQSLGNPSPDTFLWLHFSLPNAACEPWLRQHLALPDNFYTSLHGNVGSTSLEQEGDTLVAIIHDVLFDFTFDASSISTASLCIAPRLLVSARLRPLRSIDRLRAAVKRGQPFRSPAELLARLLLDQASVLVDILRNST